MKRSYTRREMLERAAVIGTVSSVPARSLAQALDAGEPYANLTAREARTLESIVARLIPADSNGPGALEAGAARYIDRALASALAPSLEAYRAGLAALDDYAREIGGRAFAELEAEVQDRVLDDLEQDVAGGFVGGAASFFELVRGHTIEGMFCDPVYGGNRDFVGWELIGYPGVRLAVGSDEQQMSARLPLNRVSAYDLPMFDDDGVHSGGDDSGDER